MSSTVNVSAIIKKDKPNETEYKKLDNNIKFSFTVSYILLLTTATITFIEALRTQTPYIRHILNLETAISVVAGYFYSIFVDKIAKSEEKAQQKKDLMAVNFSLNLYWITNYFDSCLSKDMKK